MKVCPNCSREYEDAARFCRHDGSALHSNTSVNRCPSCGREIGEGNFCVHCGVPLEIEDSSLVAVQTPNVHYDSPAEQAQAEISEVAAIESEGTTRVYQLSAMQELPGEPANEPAPNSHAEEPPVQSKLYSDTLPDMKLESVLQNSGPAAPSTADHFIEPLEEPLAPSNNKPKRLFVKVAALLAVTGLLGGALLFYYTRNEPGPLDTPPGKAADAQVMGAEELGFKISGDAATDANRSEAVISEKIKSQLDGLCSLYQQEIRRKPDLMGSMTLRLAISPTGEVTKVSTLATQIDDQTFVQSVIENASKWRFPEASLGFVQVTYPLLFLPPGMDAAALLRIVKGLPSPAVPSESVTPATENLPAEESRPQSRSQTAATATPPGTELNKPVANSQARPVETPPAPAPPQARVQVETPQVYQPAESYPMVPYETLMDTVVYREAREDSETITSLPAGTQVYVVAIRGDWLQLRSKVGNPAGYIKKESAAYVGR